MKKNSVFISLLLMPTLLFALSTYPFHCRNLTVEEYLTLETKTKPMLLVIENRSDSNVWLVNQSNGSGMDAGFDNEVSSHQSSALLISNKQKITFQCVESRSGSEQLYPCSDLIKACRATKLDLDPELKGSFWAVENSTKKELSFKLAKRGIEVE